MNQIQESPLKKILNSTPIIIIGIISALLGTGISIYAFFEEKKAELRYEIISNTNVLDFNAYLSNLEVIYDSTNLRITNENLRIYTLKLINIGNKDILKEFYDENDPIGIKISTGKIIETPELIKTTSDYLNKNVKIDRNNDKLTISKVILEPKEYFIFKFLVLHKKDTIPRLLSIGKIAGQREISIINSLDAKDEVSFFNTTFKGNIWIQIVRLISYFIIALIIILGITVIPDEIRKSSNKRKKIKKIELFKNLDDYDYKRIDEVIFDRYKDGYPTLEAINKLLKNEKKLNQMYVKIKEKQKNFAKDTSDIDYYYFDRPNKYGSRNETLIEVMIQDGFIFKENDLLRINLSLKETLDKFITFIKGHENKNDKQKTMSQVVNEEAVNN